MKVRQGLTFAVVVILAATSTVVQGGFPVSAADTNGDRHVDVLDVQTVVAQVLNTSNPHRSSDVNADGCIDILDLQRIVAQATQSEVPPPIAPTDPKREATPPDKRGVTAPAVLASRTESFLREGEGDRGCRAWTHEQAAFIPAHTERYLRTLTPHAPPCA